jgi:nucleoid-associated protein YgaU
VQEASQPSKRTGGVYVVKPGDTLWSVSKNALGSGRAVERIAAINGLAPPYNVRPGQRLRLPH